MKQTTRKKEDFLESATAWSRDWFGGGVTGCLNSDGLNLSYIHFEM